MQKIRIRQDSGLHAANPESGDIIFKRKAPNQKLRFCVVHVCTGCFVFFINFEIHYE